MSTKLFSAKHMYASYGEYSALRDVNICLERGEIHALVGEHGAGKTTLASVLNGTVPIRGGLLSFDGIKQNLWTQTKAEKAGIVLVEQRIPLSNAYTVAENLFLGNHAVTGGFLGPYRRKAVRAEARRYLEENGFSLSPDEHTSSLNMADRALVSILRELYKKPDLLILDETLEKLSSANLLKVVPMLQGLTKCGSSILFITHQIDDIYQFANRVSIIRHGEVLLTEETRKIDKLNLVRIAYTQMVENGDTPDSNSEFYHMLRYNQAILKKLPINLLVLDNRHNIKMVNDTAKAFFNIEKIRSGLNLRGLFRGTDQATLSRLTDSLSSSEQTMLYSLPLKVNDNDFQTNIIIYPVLDGLQLLGYIIILEDITEREKMRQQLLLSEKLASIGLLAAGVAHEINNPLGIIYNYLESLKWLNRESPQAGEVISSLEEQFEYIANIVSNLLTFSENRTVSTDPFNINLLAADMIKLIRLSAKAKNIEIKFENTSPMIVIADRNEIKQVLLNLLKNSFEAIGSGGTVEIETEKMEKDGTAGVLIKIRDSGPGICLENPDDIFLPFKSTKQPAGHNLGLGLSVSYNLIQKNKGSITVKNITTGGCEFDIWLPLSAETSKNESIKIQEKQ